MLHALNKNKAGSVLTMTSDAAKIKEQIDGTGPILNRLAIAIAVLKNMNLVQQLEVRADQVLCHPCNRGGLGLNAHNAHRSGAYI